MNVETLLCEEIKRELEILSTMSVGSDEYKVTVDGITKLADRAIDLEKISVDSDEKEKDRKFEAEWKSKQFEAEQEYRKSDIEIKQNQLKEDQKVHELENHFKTLQQADEQKNRLINNWLTAANILLPIGLAIWGTKKSFEFEKDGTITTIMGRGFINKLLPKK